MHPDSLSLFQTTANDCLEKQPNTYSFLSDVMYRLRRASDLQWEHENLPRVEKIVHLKNIAQEEIISAVNSFDSTHYLEAYKYNKVYKAELQKKKVIIVKGVAMLKNMIDPTIMEKDQNSVDVFTEITYQCLALETPKERPTLEVVIKSLERSHFQVNKSRVFKAGFQKFQIVDFTIRNFGYRFNETVS
ncbi:hypothetical protein QVD17_39682 [Tagetes erecta]|uniref:Uncharacterized protein n=1 Tax=Tagetes erecta TaxID=13708 RepID=A0AAD8JQW7_TARER|nr:hypothetical protein QVD17_39682 [Tagetes erecta]